MSTGAKVEREKKDTWSRTCVDSTFSRFVPVFLPLAEEGLEERFLGRDARGGLKPPGKSLLLPSVKHKLGLIVNSLRDTHRKRPFLVDELNDLTNRSQGRIQGLGIALVEVAKEQGFAETKEANDILAEAADPDRLALGQIGDSMSNIGRQGWEVYKDRKGHFKLVTLPDLSLGSNLVTADLDLLYGKDPSSVRVMIEQAHVLISLQKIARQASENLLYHSIIGEALPPAILSFSTDPEFRRRELTSISRYFQLIAAVDQPFKEDIIAFVKKLLGDSQEFLGGERRITREYIGHLAICPSTSNSQKSRYAGVVDVFDSMHELLTGDFKDPLEQDTELFSYFLSSSPMIREPYRYVPSELQSNRQRLIEERGGLVGISLLLDRFTADTDGQSFLDILKTTLPSQYQRLLQLRLWIGNEQHEYGTRFEEFVRSVVSKTRLSLGQVDLEEIKGIIDTSINAHTHPLQPNPPDGVSTEGSRVRLVDGRLVDVLTLYSLALINEDSNTQGRRELTVPYVIRLKDSLVDTYQTKDRGIDNVLSRTGQRRARIEEFCEVVGIAQTDIDTVYELISKAPNIIYGSERDRTFTICFHILFLRGMTRIDPTSQAFRTVVTEVFPKIPSTFWEYLQKGRPSGN